MTPDFVKKLVGIILLGVFFWHIAGLLWGLIAIGGVALLFLP